MQVTWRWVRSRPRLVLATLTCATIALAIVVWPAGPVNHANFQRIRPGMCQSELHSLLETPKYKAVELGIIKDPESYTISLG